MLTYLFVYYLSYGYICILIEIFSLSLGLFLIASFDYGKLSYKMSLPVVVWYGPDLNVLFVMAEAVAVTLTLLQHTVYGL